VDIKPDAVLKVRNAARGLKCHCLRKPPVRRPMWAGRLPSRHQAETHSTHSVAFQRW